MDEFLKIHGALYDETRVKILKFLLLSGAACVCELQASFKMIQSRLSRHLKILKEAGFVESTRKGKWCYYRIKENLDSYRACELDQIKSLDIEIPKPTKECSI